MITTTAIFTKDKDGDTMTKLSFLLLKVLYDNGIKNMVLALTANQVLDLMEEKPEKSETTIRRHLDSLLADGYVNTGMPDRQAATYYITDSGKDVITNASKTVSMKSEVSDKIPLLTRVEFSILKILYDKNIRKLSDAIKYTDIMALLPKGQQRSNSTMLRQLVELERYDYVRQGFPDGFTTYYITALGESVYLKILGEEEKKPDTTLRDNCIRAMLEYGLSSEEIAKALKISVDEVYSASEEMV